MSIYNCPSYLSWKPMECIEPAYGSFLSVSSFSSFTTAKAIPYDTIEVAQNIRLGTPSSRVIIQDKGVYKFSYSIQFDKPSGSAANIFIYIKVNGIAVPNSTSFVVIQGTAAEVFPMCEYVLDLNAGDYIEVFVYSSDASVTAQFFQSTINYPAVPSIITNVYRIG